MYKIARHKVILSNISYLSIFQVSNLLLSTVTYPVLIHHLGSNIYGHVVYAQAISTYLCLIVNFGLNFVGTKEISVYRKRPQKVSRTVSVIIQLKGCLFLISAMCMFVLALILGARGSELTLYMLSLWVCLTDLVFPTWYFQGIEKMLNIAVISIVNKSITLGLICTLVRSPENMLLVPLIYFFGAGMMGVSSFIILKKQGVKLRRQKLLLMALYLKKSYVIAVSNIIYSLNDVNVLVVRQFSPYEVVAYMDLASKVTNIIVTLLDVTSQAVLPRMSITKDAAFLRKVLLLAIVESLLFLLMIEVFAPRIVLVLGGKSMATAIPLVRLLAFVFPIYIVGALLGRNAMLVRGHNRPVLISMALAAIVYFTILSMVNYTIGSLTVTVVCWAWLISYAVQTLYRYLKCQQLAVI